MLTGGATGDGSFANAAGPHPGPLPEVEGKKPAALSISEKTLQACNHTGAACPRPFQRSTSNGTSLRRSSAVVVLPTNTWRMQIATGAYHRKTTSHVLNRPLAKCAKPWPAFWRQSAHADSPCSFFAWCAGAGACRAVNGGAGRSVGGACARWRCRPR